MNLSSHYTTIKGIAFERSTPTPVKSPNLVLWNQPLAEQLGLPSSLTDDQESLAQIFSGNKIVEGTDPIAAAYAGHQFGHFAQQLGDGRAHLLGDIVSTNNQRWDIQLKGSGRTAFSRGGDGRCALGPAVREFIMSEAMFALGIATTRSLAVVTTGEAVMRETPKPGAIVTRIASSHVRVGTFEFYAARGQTDVVKALADYTIDRHYPELKTIEESRYLKLLDAVIDKQISLVVDWMRVGFIHGVMNTDNTALSGETIDYGPCAMMGVYDPLASFSSIDQMGRYAFARQPDIIQWNMARFAECLLPLIHDDSDTAVKIAEPVIHAFPQRFSAAFNKMMSLKLGLTEFKDSDEALVGELLQHLEKQDLDYTNTFLELTHSLTDSAKAISIKEALGEWYTRWQTRLTEQSLSDQDCYKLMKQHNPVVIPRNHHMEEVIDRAVESGDFEAANDFLNVLQSPYEAIGQTHRYQDLPADGDQHYQTFCGT